VFADRFPAALDYVEEPLPAHLADASGDPAADVARRESAAEGSAKAREVFAELTPAEHQLMSVLDHPTMIQQEVLGLGRSQTHRKRDALWTRLRAMLGPEPDRSAVFTELIDLCRDSHPPRAERRGPDDSLDATSESTAGRRAVDDVEGGPRER
jgi:hypothetical protein